MRANLLTLGLHHPMGPCISRHGLKPVGIRMLLRVSAPLDVAWVSSVILLLTAQTPSAHRLTSLRKQLVNVLKKMRLKNHGEMGLGL